MVDHELVSIHKDSFTTSNTTYWITTFICKCGFQSHVEKTFDTHLHLGHAKQLADEVLIDLKERLKQK